MASLAETAAERFAACLLGLKERSGRSYGQLAGRLHVSTSTLHRYCTGRAVPMEYGPVERMARLCGATPDELVRLHRLWLRADAARGKARPERSVGGAGGADVQESAVPESADAERAGSGSGGPGAGADRPRSEPTSAVRSPSAAAALPVGGPGTGKRVVVEPVPAGTKAPEADGRRERRRGGVRSWIRPVAAVVALAATIGVTALVAGTPDGRPNPERRAAAAPPDVPEASGGSASPSPTASAHREEPAAEASPSASRGTRQAAPAGERQTGAAGEADGPALSWTARSHVWQHHCDHRYLIDRPASQVPQPPMEQDARSWATALGAVHGGGTVVEATVRAAGREPVVVEDVYVRVAERSEPLGWPSFSMSNGCGGALTPAAFLVDLDAARPVPRPRDGYDGDGGTPLPATRLPYQVSAGDPLVLRIEARTEEYDCDWYVEVRWSSGERSGRLRIDDGGEPFRTSGIRGPEYGYRWTEGVWSRA